MVDPGKRVSVLKNKVLYWRTKLDIAQLDRLPPGQAFEYCALEGKLKSIIRELDELEPNWRGDSRFKQEREALMALEKALSRLAKTFGWILALWPLLF